MANRLTENDSVSVLLLEAGGKILTHTYICPLVFEINCGPRTWGFNTVPQKYANNREIPMRKARFLVVVPP